MATISAIIIAQNEEQMIANCIETLRWCDEVIVVDDQSRDNTALAAEHAGAKVFTTRQSGFTWLRNLGKKHATGEWVLYIDADERVTPKLRDRILEAMGKPGFSAYSLKRNDIHYGRWMEFGDWGNDRVVRLFKKDQLKTWAGEVHEHAEVNGHTGEIDEPLVHLTHRNMLDGLKKSMTWTDIEAQLLFQAGHRKIGPLTLVKVTLQEFLRRAILKRGFKDGAEGWIESMVQAMNRFLVYERLWELQRKPSLEESYAQIEKEILRQWEHDRA
ncbi:MAG TPA: glycosyltransferase family 2 protein [Candidatus Saccharimonadia bacterium]|nr:glycosyltransferase family 2 protein [Candidatus Saccharimonadia bacterium]